jgi:hypothetical protein
MTTRDKLITSSTLITTTSSILLADAMNGLLSNLAVEIIDEDLDHKAATGNVYVTRNQNLLAEPKVRVRRIDNTGADILQFLSTDYTINHALGEITLGTGTTDIIRTDYFYQPLTDATLDTLMSLTVQEIANLIYRKIDATSVPAEYNSVIQRRFQTNVLRNLMNETRDYFAINIAGRSISKDAVPSHFDMLIKSNEEQLKEEIHLLRFQNTTNRLS